MIKKIQRGSVSVPGNTNKEITLTGFSDVNKMIIITSGEWLYSCGMLINSASKMTLYPSWSSGYTYTLRYCVVEFQ